MTTTVLLEIALRPDALDTAPEVIRQTLVATAAAEGNEGLEVIVDDADPTRVIIVEKWRTTADHSAYLAWRQTPEGANELGSVLSGPPVTRVFGSVVEL
jgi:quinol monooxygenase YgiN